MDVCYRHGFSMSDESITFILSKISKNCHKDNVKKPSSKEPFLKFDFIDT